MKTIRDYLISIISHSRESPKLQDKVIKFYNLFYPLPYEEPGMEFTQGVWAGISTIRCTEGRQIGETNSVPVEFYRPSPTQFHQGNLDGSRAGYSINLTALQHIMRLWPDLLGFIGFIRQLTLNKLNINHNPLTTMEMYIVALVGVSVPAYMARRKNNPITDTQITSIVADQQKLITGVFMMVRHMIERGNLNLSTTSFMTGTQLFDYCDEHGLFLAPTGAKTACGGAKRKIIELIDHVIQGDEKYSEITDAAQESIKLMGDLDSFMTYALAGIEMELSLMLARAAMKNKIMSSPQFLAENLTTKQVSQWNRVRKHLLNQSCTNANLSHQISVLCTTLELIKAEPDYQDWLALCTPNTDIDLATNLLEIYTQMQTYFNNRQQNILHILGHKITKKNAQIKLADINKKIAVLPACVFKEIISGN